MKIKRFWKRPNNKLLLRAAMLEATKIREKSTVLALCAQTSGYSWLGVNVATHSLFPGISLEIPQYYSHSIFSDSELKDLTFGINNLGFEQVIISGFAPFYDRFVTELSKNTRVKILYHGFLAELSQNPIQQQAFTKILKHAKSGRIEAIGCVKKGLALSLEKLYGLNTFEIILPNPQIRNPLVSSSENSIQIGCLVNTSFRKNIHNQVFAALMIPSATVHVFDSPELDYFPQDRLRRHSFLAHDEFIELLASMTINLHVTFSEGMGGQVCAESISQGVPCISAYSSSFFDYDAYLKEKLIVQGVDDSWFIYQKIEEVLAERDKLSKKCTEYAHLLNELAEKRLASFLL